MTTEQDKTKQTLEDFRAMITERYRQHRLALDAHRFARFRKNFFTRFHRDPEAAPGDHETEVTKQWRIVLPDAASETAVMMAGHLVEFFEQSMGLSLPLELVAPDSNPTATTGAVVLLESGGGDPEVPESFTIEVVNERAVVTGRDSAGLRDGIVRLVDRIGFRGAPILARDRQVYRPRIAVRQGGHGSNRDTVFMGYNAVQVDGLSLYAISESDAIPQLAARRRPSTYDGSLEAAREARKYGLKTYFMLLTYEKFADDDPIFEAHPDVRGALTWKKDGDYTLCTEHPLVKQYLSETISGFFRHDPLIDGIIVIIGGEGFYHCFMRPYGVEKGHTNCARCEALGAETVVANLCNLLADAARSVNPNAQVLAWPYSAAHVWSADKAQTGFIERLQPGVTLQTEIVKDEVIEKPGGVRKELWDYSIDLIGPGERAKQQIAACHKNGNRIRVLSMAEHTFEASLLPHLPCMDRWADRAEALASCGADSVNVFQMGPYDASSAAEVNKLFWWDPVPEKEAMLERLAARIAGPEAGPHVRSAWRYVSEAMDFSPEIGPYYQGPHYLGPMHPMCADAEAKVPQVFYGYYMFLREMTAEEAFKGRPAFHTLPRGDAVQFEGYYQNMTELLRQAAEQMNTARPLVPDRCRLMFDAEDCPVQWFYRTARTAANFYASCRLRERFRALVHETPGALTPEMEATRLYEEWRAVLLDEQDNARAAVAILEQDLRLDPYQRGDHALSHGMDMLEEKLRLVEHELAEVLPAAAKRCGFDPGDVAADRNI